MQTHDKGMQESHEETPQDSQTLRETLINKTFILASHPRCFTSEAFCNGARRSRSVACSCTLNTIVRRRGNSDTLSCHSFSNIDTQVVATTCRPWHNSGKLPVHSNRSGQRKSPNPYSGMFRFLCRLHHFYLLPARRTFRGGACATCGDVFAQYAGVLLAVLA